MTPTHPLVIIGLDGGSMNVLAPLFARGELPHLQRLSASGLTADLRSTLPPATLPAWTSFLTGKKPSEHGVTDIFVHRKHSYNLVPASAALRSVPTLLARLSSLGLRVASLGVPGTYPLEPVNGIAIAGFDAPGASAARPDAVWPQSLWPQLQALGGWRYATFNEHHGQASAGAVRALLDDLEVKERVILALHRREPWDVFMVHLQASDTAGHHLWDTFDGGSPRHTPGPLADALPSIYRRLDTLIGRLLAQAPAQARVLVVSDHGMAGASDVAVHLNRLLHELGLLHFRPASQRLGLSAVSRALRATTRRLPTPWLGWALRALPTRLKGRLLALFRHQPFDAARTLAFSDELDYAPTVWLNRAGVFPRGSVAASEVDGLLSRISDALLQLRDPRTGAALVTAVHRRADLHTGPHAQACPDLVIEPAWPNGYRPSFLTSGGPGASVRILEPQEFRAGKGAGMPGVHRREGIFIAAGPGLQAQSLPAFDIWQASAFVYELLGLPAPSELASFPATLSAPDPYSDADRLEVTRRLADLGYIE